MWKVMIADDEVFIRDGLKKLIKWDTLGCELVYSAKNGQDLLDNFSVCIPNIVILDIKMPIMSGLEVVAYLREHYPEIKIVLLTAYADFEYTKQAILYSVNDYIVKTAILEEIPNTISCIVKDLEEAKVKANIVPQGERLFYRILIEDSIITDDYYFEYKHYYDSFNEKFPSFSLILCQIVNENIQLNSALQKSIFDLMKTVFDGNTFRSFKVSRTEYCIIIDGDINKKEKIEFLCNKFNNLAQSFLGIKTIIGISRFYSRIENVSKAYKNTLKEIMQNFDGGNNVVFFEKGKINYINRKEQFYIVDSIVDSINNGRHLESVDSLDKLINLYNINGLATTKSSLILLLATCRKIWRDQGADLDKVIFDNRNIDSEILNTKKVLELKNIFNDIINDTVKLVLEQKERRDDLIRDIDNYINNNYCNRITLDEIANEVHVNSSYLSRTYKLKTGKNLFDVVNIKKIEKSKEYIAKYNKKINEVALLVGFSDSAYFSRVFKKYTGLTPKEFERAELSKMKSGII